MLGQYLKKLRKQRNLTLRAVEEKTGISNAYLSQVENGKISKPSPSILLKLGNFYDVSYERLMKLAGHPVPTKSEVEKGELDLAFRFSSSLDDLTEEERKRVQEYIEFLRSRKRLQR